MKKFISVPIIVVSLFIFLLETPYAIAKIGRGSPEYRAISGVSMGGYGAMNIGLSHPEEFKTIACLGGPLDMTYLLKYLEVDMLGDFDNTPSYPSRGTRIKMLKDLVISFGNPVYYNPLSTYYPPRINSDNANVATTLLNFKDGALNPDGSLPVITFEDSSPGNWIEVLLALDLNGNGKRNVGERVIRQFHEPFIDANGNGMYEPGETYSDVGLDGVAGTGDYGEGDGKFTYSPHRDNFLAQDPLTHLKNLPSSTLQNLNLYIDAGTQDEFEFNIHAENFVEALQSKGLPVRIENGFPESIPDVSHFWDQNVYVRYEGGHVGFNEEDIGNIIQEAIAGVKGAITVANRFATLFAFVSDRFPNGDYGTNFYELYEYPSEMGVVIFDSPSLNRKVQFGVYLPPGYWRSHYNYYPVLYLMGGYNMSVEGLANEWVQLALDYLIYTEEMQKMIIVVVDGENYKNGRGHFFVNQIDKERGDNFMDYFFDVMDYVDERAKTR